MKKITIQKWLVISLSTIWQSFWWVIVKWGKLVSYRRMMCAGEDVFARDWPLMATTLLLVIDELWRWQAGDRIIVTGTTLHIEGWKRRQKLNCRNLAGVFSGCRSLHLQLQVKQFREYFGLKNNEQCAPRGTLFNKCHLTKTNHQHQPEHFSSHQSESESHLHAISQNWTWKYAATWSQPKTKY